MLRDVTERRESDLRLRAVLAERSRVAAALQRSLAPPALPGVPGLRTATCYAPAGQGSEIGGDFYDVFPLDDGRWAVVLGDVSGKGAEAAAVTAQVRYTVRALASGGRPPVDVLRALNDALLRESADERYATLVYAVVERSGCGWRLSVSLAGHHPPLLRSRTGEVRPVGRPGTALGLLDDPELSETEVSLSAGEVLCLFTDGLVEARRGAELFGEERVRQVLADSCPKRLEDVVQRLEQAAREFSGGPLADDLALLLLRSDVPEPCAVARQTGS